MKGKYKKLNESYQTMMKYSEKQNFPFIFYDLAGKYLPKDEKAIVIDVGCGPCRFENYLNLWDTYENLTLLDGNNDTLDKLRNKHSEFNILNYRVPDRIPFDNGYVDYIFCAHLIEHLDFKQLYDLCKEFDRVLKNNGILVISSPMLWINFYDTLDHIRPYHSSIFKFLFIKKFESLSYKPISRSYKIEKLVYRYHYASQDLHKTHNRLGSSIKSIDFLIQVIGRISRLLKIRRYVQTGYTIILRKGK